MSRPRVPTNILTLRGAYRRNPKRLVERAGEPVSDAPIGEPPEHLTGEARAAWGEISGLAPLGTFCPADRVAVEICAVLLAQFRESPNDFPAAKLTRLESLLGRFGLTPSDRSRISVAKPEPRNKYAALSDL